MLLVSFVATKCETKKLLYLCRAVRQFSAAISADPTFIKAYLCRAEAYTRLHSVSIKPVPVLVLFLIRGFFVQRCHHDNGVSFLLQKRLALLDITRAIHLRPDVHHYYMCRVNHFVTIERNHLIFTPDSASTTSLFCRESSFSKWENLTWLLSAFGNQYFLSKKGLISKRKLVSYFLHHIFVA